MELPLVVGIDGSADALRAVGWGADEAALRGCPLQAASQTELLVVGAQRRRNVQ